MGTIHRGHFPETLDKNNGANGAHNHLTVVIVDDQPVFRTVAKSVLEREGDCDVVGEAEDGQGAIRLVEACEPDVVVMDIQMAEVGGIEATRRILETHPGTNIVLVSMGADSEYPRLAREIGARGFLPKRSLNSRTLREMLGLGPMNNAPAAIAA
jgi:DNA-binding NarL/FixJ family response regulator